MDSDDVLPVTLVGPADDDAESALVDRGGLIEKLPTGSGGGRAQGSLLMSGEASRDCRQPVKRCRTVVTTILVTSVEHLLICTPAHALSISR